MFSFLELGLISAWSSWWPTLAQCCFENLSFFRKGRTAVRPSVGCMKSSSSWKTEVGQDGLRQVSVDLPTSGRDRFVEKLVLSSLDNLLVFIRFRTKHPKTIRISSCCPKSERGAKRTWKCWCQVRGSTIC